MSTSISTSIAAEVAVNLFDKDSIPLALGFEDNSSLLAYGFTCEFSYLGEVKKTYTIAANATTSTFLAKTNSNTTLDMQGMFEDIQAQVIGGQKYQLVVTVTQPDGLNFVYVKFNINASKH